jgi:6-phosphogluconolactonase
MLTFWDERRDIAILESHDSAIEFAVEHWIHCYKRAVQSKGSFSVALSGGSTPKAIYERLAQSSEIKWDLIYFFWSDERAVQPDHPESNYKMAVDTHLLRSAVPSQIFRMRCENRLPPSAKEYEEMLKHHLQDHSLDLVMLGVGEDGHTASLFPNTAALSIQDRLVVPNYIEEKELWRMTFTYKAIHIASCIVIYALGPQKASIVNKVLNAPIISQWPASFVGTPEHKAVWVLDKEAAKQLSVK